jgi:hypothetical protein
MSRFGWAYVNSSVTGAVANGPTNSVQFNSGSQVLSGSSNFTFNPATNTLVVTGTISASVYQGITVTATPAGSDKQIQYNSGSALGASSNFTFDYLTNTLYLTGTLRADNLIVSSSQILKSGSTIFGDDGLDTHQFTGSILGGIVSGTTAQFTTITGSIVTGSTALFTTLTASNITASNQLQVASDAFIGGNIVVSGGFKAAYATYTGSFTAAANSYFIGISTTGSVVTASLNSATNYPAGQTLIFKDIGGNAAVNNIRIKPSGSQTIDGATSLVISSTSGSVTLVSNGLDGFYIVGLT